MTFFAISISILVFIAVCIVTAVVFAVYGGRHDRDDDEIDFTRADRL